MALRRLPLLLAMFIVAATAATALADVQVRAAVSPDTLSQCSAGQVFTAIGNTGTDRIFVHVCVRIMRADSVVLGPICGRLSLAPGERRTREFPILIPPRFPVGRYAIAIHAIANDSTSDRALAPFTVVPGICAPPTTSAGEGSLLDTVIQGLGVSPDGATEVRSQTWGTLKLRYR